MKESDKMICKYSYRLKNSTKIFGEYQADTEDFKKFFHNQYKNLAMCLVITPEYIYLYTEKTNNKYSGWQFVKNLKDKKF